MAAAIVLTGCTGGAETVSTPTQTPAPTLVPKEEKPDYWEVELDQNKIVPLETIEVTEEQKQDSSIVYLKGHKGQDDHTGDDQIEDLLEEIHAPKAEMIIVGKEVQVVIEYNERYSTYYAEFQDYNHYLKKCPNVAKVAGEKTEDGIGHGSYEGVLYDHYTNYHVLSACPPKKSGAITIPYGTTVIVKCAFMNCSRITSVHIPSSVVEIEEAAFGGNTSCTSIEVESDNPYFMSKDGVLYTKDGTVLIAYPAGKEGEEFRVPDGVKVIRQAAFMGAKNLKKVVLSDEVEILENEAFRDCKSLLVFEGGKNLRELYAGVFYNCENLESVNFQPSLHVVYEKVFDKTDCLKTISLPPTVEYIYGEKDERIKKQKRPAIEMDREFVNAKGASKGTGTPDISWYKEGKKNYKLSTADDLAGFAKLVNQGISFNRCVVSLKNDIDLRNYKEWTPIGGKFIVNGKKKKYYFEGSFDGKGHTIYNLTITKGKKYSGLFSKLYVTEEIRNLNIEGAYVIGGKKSAILVGDSDGDITNCSVDGNLWGTTMVGGIAGMASGLKQITNCCNKADIVGNLQVGGICGFGDGAISCKNEGNISGYCVVGGIIGEKTYGSQEMLDCQNTGKVSGSTWVDEFYVDSFEYDHWVDR